MAEKITIEKVGASTVVTFTYDENSTVTRKVFNMPGNISTTTMSNIISINMGIDMLNFDYTKVDNLNLSVSPEDFVKTLASEYLFTNEVGPVE